MSNFLKNKCLSTYFLLDAFISPSADRRALIKKLADVFCLDDADGLYAAVMREEVENVKNLADYYRHLRILEFKANIRKKGVEASDTPDPVDEELIAIKGNVLAQLEKQKILTARLTGVAAALISLTEAANLGTVIAMYAYGIMTCEGLEVEADPDEGARYLKKVADWNNTEACIACIYYCGDLRREYADKLYTYLLRTPYSKDVKALFDKYGVTPERDEIASLTCKLFPHHVAVTERYDGHLARILKCGALSEPDKQDVVLSGSRDMIRKVNALPLNLKSWKNYCVKPVSPSIGCEKDKAAVALALKNVDTLRSEKYRPLCICSDDTYMLNAYIKAISDTFADCKVSHINVPELGAHDPENRFRSAVLHAIKESNRNVVIISVYGQRVADPQLSPVYSEIVHTALNTDSRGAFKTDLGLGLNLTDLMPVVVCDRQNVGKFRSDCHVVRLSAMTDEDRKHAILHTAEADSSLYGLAGYKIEDDALNVLTAMQSNKAIVIIDKLFAAYDDGERAVITREGVKAAADEMDVIQTGF